MTRDLVLGGGGAKGAFQVGVLEVLLDAGYHFRRIYGTSVGALNGAMLAQDRFQELCWVWDTIDSDSIYHKTTSPLEDIFASVVPHGEELWDITNPAVYSNAPVWELIKEHIHHRELVTPLRIGVVDLYAGVYHTLRSEDFRLVPGSEFQLAILASTAQPVIWPCVPSMYLERTGWMHDLCDGGVMRTIPAMDCYEEATVDPPDETIIIPCGNYDMARSPVPTKTVLGRLKRTFDLVLTDNGAGDLQFATFRFAMSKLAYRLIAPQADLGDGLDFSPAENDRRRKHGQDIAKQFLNDWPHNYGGGE